MSTPVHGDEEIDRQLIRLREIVEVNTNPGVLKNGSKKVLKDLLRAVAHLQAETQYSLIEKIEQSIGGVKSITRTLKST